MPKFKRLCSVEGCNKKHKAKNFCAAHYARYLKGLLIDTPIRQYKERPRNAKCEIDGCEDLNYLTGLCRFHYEKKWRLSRA